MLMSLIDCYFLIGMSILVKHGAKVLLFSDICKKKKKKCVQKMLFCCDLYGNQQFQVIRRHKNNLLG